MKKKAGCRIWAIMLLAAVALCASSCSAAPSHMIDGKEDNPQSGYNPPFDPAEDLQFVYSENREEGQNGQRIAENPFVNAESEPTSTFSADADSASYTLMRRLINTGYNLSELTATAGESIRTEELVNYFRYEYPEPEEGRLFGVKATLAPSPYGETALLKLTLGTKRQEPCERNNLVFLIDVSGSMASADKLGLLKKAFRYLTDRLGSDDTVSIVTYSGREEVVLEGCSGEKKEMILNAIDSLAAGGYTNGEAGLREAYRIAEKYRIEGGNNRIFMASDGDLNVGISSAEELKEFIAEKRSSGVFLSVLGFGGGNYKDANMEALADNGNGVYLYIDGESEAEKVFGDDLFANLYTVAKDVKLQITFNARAVESYRLIGYENRVLRNEDFENDVKDAGELGAGHTVTVFYELRLRQGIDFTALAEYDTDAYDILADLAVRYKDPDGEKSKEETFAVSSGIYTHTPDDDFKFAAALVECSAILRNSAYKGDASMEHLADVLKTVDVEGDVYRSEFKQLIDKLIANGK